MSFHWFMCTQEYKDNDSIDISRKREYVFLVREKLILSECLFLLKFNVIFLSKLLFKLFDQEFKIQEIQEKKFQYNGPKLVFDTPTSFHLKIKQKLY